MNGNEAPTVVAFFARREDAEAAYSELQESGFSEDRIGLIGKDFRGKVERKGAAGQTYGRAGAAFGAALGTLTGAVVGGAMFMGVLPVFGPIVAIGDLGSVVMDMLGGLILGIILGTLMGRSLPGEDAIYYERSIQQVREGQYLVGVAGDDRVGPWNILSRHGGAERV